MLIIIFIHTCMSYGTLSRHCIRLLDGQMLRKIFQLTSQIHAELSPGGAKNMFTVVQLVLADMYVSLAAQE